MNIDLLTPINSNQPLSHTQAIANRDEAVWQSLANVSLTQAVEFFLKTLRGNTQRTYRAAFRSYLKIVSRFSSFFSRK